MTEEIKIKKESLPDIKVEDIKLLPMEEVHIEAKEVHIPDSEPIILVSEILSSSLNVRIELLKP